MVHSLQKHGYQKEGMIGAGAFGTVWLISQVGGGRLSACKETDTPRGRKLLKWEASLIQQISHPLFARFERYWEEGNKAFLVMEYIAGQSLTDYLKQHTLTLEQLLDMTRQLGEGIAHLHHLPEPLLYRDMKPENIRVESGGRLRLLDLGCACRISEAQRSKAGTRGYAPPEQMGEGQVGFFSDIYSLGKIMEYMWSQGGLEQGAADRSYHKHNLGEIQRKRWRLFLNKCIAENAEERFQNMSCVLKNLGNKEDSILYERSEGG